MITHRLFTKEGFDFIDDIIWVKPEGVGWATGRGRRFAADRNPLQYKPVPVTEYVLVYRKHTKRRGRSSFRPRSCHSCEGRNLSSPMDSRLRGNDSLLLAQTMTMPETPH